MANTKEQQSVKDIEKIAEMMLSITQDQNQMLSIQDELEQKIKNQSEELKSQSLAINNLKKAFIEQGKILDNIEKNSEFYFFGGNNSFWLRTTLEKVDELEHRINYLKKDQNSKE